MRNFILFILLSVVQITTAQVNTDSLEEILPKLELKEKVKVLNDLCWELGGVNRDKASGYGKSAIKLAQKIEDDTLLAQAYNDYGTLFLRYGEYDSTQVYFEKSLRIRKVLKDTLGMSSVYSKLGVMSELKGDYALALEYNLDVLKIFEQAGDKYKIGQTKNNIAIIYYQLSQYDLATKINKEAEDLIKDSGNERLMFLVYHTYGNIHLGKGNVDSAIYYMEMSLPLAEKVGDLTNKSIILNNLAAEYEQKGEFEIALKYAFEALEIREEHKDLKGIGSTSGVLAKIYLKLGDTDKAITYNKKSEEHSMKVGAKENLRTTYFTYSEIFEQKQDWQNAFIYQKKLTQISDSIRNDNFSKQIAEMEAKYETDKKDAAIKLLNNENALEKEKNERQQLVLYGSSGGIILLLGLVFFILRGYSQKKKANDLISQKNEELSQVNEEILAQRDEIEKQKEKVEHAHKEIQDSIIYAKRIQQAILPPEETIKACLPDSFVLYKPKDVVAGDFYWVQQLENVVLFAAADCTGHGVPGAMVSVVCNNALNRAVREYNLKMPGEILDKTKEIVVEEFSKSDKNVNDGMDIALCAIDFKAMKLWYAGANNPLFVVREGKPIEIKADRSPIGKSHLDSVFVNHELNLEKDDWIYSYSDGFIDQFGGEFDKKFGSKRFKQLLLNSSKNNANMQKMALNLTLKNWMDEGSEEQLDDICVIGVKV